MPDSLPSLVESTAEKLIEGQKFTDIRWLDICAVMLIMIGEEVPMEGKDDVVQVDGNIGSIGAKLKMGRYDYTQVIYTSFWVFGWFDYRV